MKTYPKLWYFSLENVACKSHGRTVKTKNGEKTQGIA